MSVIHKNMPQPAIACVLSFIAGAALIVAYAMDVNVAAEVSLTTVLLALGLSLSATLAYHFTVHVQRSTKIDLGTIACYLTVVLLPAPLAVLVAGIGCLAGEIMTQRSRGAYVSDIVTAVTRRMITVMIGVAVLQQGGQHSFLSLCATACALLILDIVTLALVVAPMSGDRPFAFLRSAAKEMSLSEVTMYMVGIVTATAARVYPPSILLLILPLTVVYRSLKNSIEMQDSTRFLLENMADAVDLRDTYTGGHSRRVTEYTASILKALDVQGPEVALIISAARVHDIGKIGVPDAILNKPDKLTPDERAVMENHAALGADLLRKHSDFARGAAIVRHHHESWDGTGYPDKLKGTEIPFGARVIAVADSYDAMTSDRPYRRGMPIEKATRILREGRDKQWDAAIVDAFLSTLADLIPPDATQALHIVSSPVDTIPPDGTNTAARQSTPA